MFIKLLILSLILVGMVMLVLGIKRWFDPNAEFTVHSCAAERGSPGHQGYCSACGTEDTSHCLTKDTGTDNR